MCAGPSVLPGAMIDRKMSPLEFAADAAIARQLVRHDHRVTIDVLADRLFQGRAINAVDLARPHPAIALDECDDRRLLCAAPTLHFFVRSRTRLAPDISFIDLDRSLEQRGCRLAAHCVPDAVC